MRIAHNRIPILSNQRFGKLTIIEELESKKRKGGVIRNFLIKCDCGKQRIVTKSYLDTGEINKCICQQYFITDLPDEIWKDVTNYEGLYQVSNMGRVKSLDKYVKGKNGGTIFKRGRLLAERADSNNYLQVLLCKENKNKSYKIHLLVWDHFSNELRNGIKLQVDHKDDNRQNNKYENFQLLTPRENTTKAFLRKDTTSKYTGVWFDKRRSKWIAEIKTNKKKNYLGSFINEIDAHFAYQSAKQKLFVKGA